MLYRRDCPNCGTENYTDGKTRATCIKCGKPLDSRLSTDGLTHSGDAELLRIAAAMERNATATERIYRLMLVLALLGLIVGAFSWVLLL